MGFFTTVIQFLLIDKSKVKTKQALVPELRTDPRILTAKRIREELSLFFRGDEHSSGHPVLILANDRTLDVYVTDLRPENPPDIKWKTTLQRNGKPMEQAHKLILFDGRIPEYTITTVIVTGGSQIPENASESREPDLAMLTVIVSDLQTARLQISQKDLQQLSNIE